MTNINHAKRMLAHLENQMTNDLKPLSNVPHHILARVQARMAVPVNDAIIGGGGQPNHISIKGNRFTLVSADGEKIELQTLFFDCIIVGHNPNMSQSYYEGAYDPLQVDFKPPDCWADNGVGPSTNAGSPQAPTCAVCDKKKWGSDTSNLTGKGKPACQSSRKLAVFYGDTIYQLKVTPGSFKNWNSYVKYLGPAGVQNPLNYEDVITRVSFAGTGVLKFEPTPGGNPYVPAEAYEMMEKVKEDQIYRDVLGLDDKPIGETPQEPPVRDNSYPKMVHPGMERDPRPTEATPAPAEATEAPARPRRRKANGEGIEAPQEPPQASQSMADKVAAAFNFNFKR
jgi:hypothetical protein